MRGRKKGKYRIKAMSGLSRPDGLRASSIVCRAKIFGVYLTSGEEAPARYRRFFG
jgi:hypothetical protein